MSPVECGQGGIVKMILVEAGVKQYPEIPHLQVDGSFFVFSEYGIDRR
jgi:hypothetical protein